MMSLCELRRAVMILDRDCAGARVEKIVEQDARRLVLSLYRAGRGDLHLLFCIEPQSARLSMIASRPAAPPTPPGFAQLLRARIAGARVSGARIVDGDRQAALRFDGEAGVFELLLAILGPRTNLHLLDGEGRVLGALRPLVETRRDLAIGAVWKSPASKPPNEGEDRCAAEPDERFFVTMEALAAAREGAQETDTLHRRADRALRRALASIDKKVLLLRGDVAAGDVVAALRHQGELLKGAVGSVKRGAREVRVRDFASGEEVAIPLDPVLSPRDNLEALFAKARKAERRAERGLRESGEAEARRAATLALRAEFDAIPAGDVATLAAFAGSPEVARLLARFAAEPSPPAALAATPAAAPPKRRVWRLGKQEIPARLVPRVYRSSGGLEIWVGRSDEGNDLLSTRLARGHDLFFHLEASPGSHVVLRTEGRSDPPAEAVLEAAEMAVHFSRHRKLTEAHVIVAPIKGVSKPRGAKPGLVYVTGGKSLRLRRDPHRLARVLSSRADASGDD
jgi:predicted ribosome quality control (RQC) complex YloA/Tae2 family protein